MKKITITIELIMRLRPCYDPVTGRDQDGRFINKGYLTEDYEATIIEFLRHPEIPVEDKFWLVLRRDFIPEKTLRLFAVWCAREAMKLVESPSPASINAIDTAERFANGKGFSGDLNDQAWEMLSPLLMSARAARRAKRAGGAEYEAVREAQLKKLILMIQNQDYEKGKDND